MLTPPITEFGFLACVNDATGQSTEMPPASPSPPVFRIRRRFVYNIGRPLLGGTGGSKWLDVAAIRTEPLRLNDRVDVFAFPITIAVIVILTL